MNRTFLKVLLTLAVSIVVCVCVVVAVNIKQVRGSGNIVTQERAVESFSSVGVSGGIELFLSEGDSKVVKIVADDNIQQYVELVNKDGKLKIALKGGLFLNTKSAVKVYLSANSLKGVSGSGGTNITLVDTLKQDDFEIDLSGGAKMSGNVAVTELDVDMSGGCSLKLKGSCQSFSLDGSGGAKCLSFDLSTENADIDLSGGSKCEITVEKKLSFNGSGGASLTYKGGASIVKQEKSGGALIKKL